MSSRDFLVLGAGALLFALVPTSAGGSSIAEIAGAGVLGAFFVFVFLAPLKSGENPTRQMSNWQNFLVEVGLAVVGAVLLVYGTTAPEESSRLVMAVGFVFALMGLALLINVLVKVSRFLNIL